MATPANTTQLMGEAMLSPHSMGGDTAATEQVGWRQVLARSTIKSKK
jgi:hypothetical protein